MEISDALSREETLEIKDEDYAPPVSLMLLAGWLKANAIQHGSMNTEVASKAREHAGLFLFHIKNILRILRGDAPSEE